MSYSAELSQKVKRGIAMSASKCKYFGGSVPLGYKVDEQKNFVVNEETAPLVKDTIANEKAMQINYSYADIRKWLSHFRTLDYSKTKNRKALIDTFKVLFHLKGGQQGELLLNLIFPDYPDGHENTDEYGAKEKETDKSVSLSSGCSHAPVMVRMTGVEPARGYHRNLKPARLPIPPHPLMKAPGRVLSVPQRYFIQFTFFLAFWQAFLRACPKNFPKKFLPEIISPAVTSWGSSWGIPS